MKYLFKGEFLYYYFFVLCRGALNSSGDPDSGHNWPPSVLKAQKDLFSVLDTWRRADPEYVGLLEPEK